MSHSCDLSDLQIQSRPEIHMNNKPLIAVIVFLAGLCLAMGADTFWQVYFGLGRTCDATVTSVAEETRRGSRVTYQKYKLCVRWNDEQGLQRSGETETDRSQKISVGDTVRIQYVSHDGLIRLASHQTIISPILFLASLTALIGVLVWVSRANAPSPDVERESKSERKSQRPKKTRPIKRLKPVDPDADR